MANLLERSLGEVKRRTKVIGRFPGETGCLMLVWAVHVYITHATNGVRFTELEGQRLRRLRYESLDETIPEEVSATQTDRLPEPESWRSYSSSATRPSGRFRSSSISKAW